MGLSYTWCNSTKIISFLDHRYQKDLMVKKQYYPNKLIYIYIYI